jgi:hypothetical protein
VYFLGASFGRVSGSFAAKGGALLASAAVLAHYFEFRID